MLSQQKVAWIIDYGICEPHISGLLIIISWNLFAYSLVIKVSKVRLKKLVVIKWSIFVTAEVMVNNCPCIIYLLAQHLTISGVRLRNVGDKIN